jgi:hypothetical protein
MFEQQKKELEQQLKNERKRKEEEANTAQHIYLNLS